MTHCPTVNFFAFSIAKIGQIEEKFKMSPKAWIIKGTPQHSLEKNYC